MTSATIADLARRQYQQRYLRVWLSTRSNTNTYDQWTDISRYVLGSSIGGYSKSIDSDDFDIGFYEESNVTLALDNSEALFNEGTGFFINSRLLDRSRVKIHAGYINSDNNEATFDVVFEGVIDDRATDVDEQNDSIKITVLAYSSIINRLRAEASVSDGQDFKTALYNLLNVGEITSLLTVSLANINPQVNETIDDSSWFNGKQLDEAINRLLLASNSIIKIKNNTIYIAPRLESSTIRFQFFGRGAPAAKVNVISLRNFNNGARRVITRAQVNSQIQDAPSDIIGLYGARLKNISLGFINNFEKEKNIANAIIDEFSFPKKELELVTDYLGNEVDLLDMVTIQNEGQIVDAVPALYGQRVYGGGTYVRRIGAVRLSAAEAFKVLAVQHDFNRYTTTLKLRSVGNKAYDSSANYKAGVRGTSKYGAAKYA